MASSLKQNLEETLAQAIMDFAGVGGAHLDPDLSTRQQVKTARGGYLLLSQDYKNGPLVAVKVLGYIKQQDATGGGDIRSMLHNARVRVAGLSQYSSDITQTVRDRDTLEEIIMLNLLKVELATAESDYSSGGKESYAINLNFLSNEFEEEIVPGEQAAKQIAQPVAAGGNSSTGTLAVNTARGVMASLQTTYTVQIVAGNPSPGSLTGATWRWKKGLSGSYSSAQSATGDYQNLADGLQIQFALASGQGFVAGDTWTITVNSSNKTQYVGIFTAEYQIQCEAITGF